MRLLVEAASFFFGSHVLFYTIIPLKNRQSFYLAVYKHCPKTGCYFSIFETVKNQFIVNYF